ncbi:MAG: hypothetical protein V2A79_09970 [Planctomycetota bacterium]
MIRRAWVVVWHDPASGLDEFWAGDSARDGCLQFEGLGTAALFPTSEMAEIAYDDLCESLPLSMAPDLAVRTVKIEYEGPGKP